MVRTLRKPQAPDVPDIDDMIFDVSEPHDSEK